MSITVSACAVCGVPSSRSSLVRNHITPRKRGEKYSSADFVFLCANCNAMMNIPPLEIEFNHFLCHLMRENSDYSDVSREQILGQESRYRADVLATRVQGTRRVKLLIECKTSRFASFNNIYDVISQIKKYKAAYGECQPVLAIPATLSEGEAKVLSAEGIELWDLDFLAKTFSKQLEDAPVGYLRSILLMRAQRSVTTRASELCAALKACQPGRRDWSVYQNLVGSVIEYLFCPVLAKPLAENSDGYKVNRRDFIVPNYAETGFWSFLRSKYMADYLVVDAKNYSKKVGKSEVLQVANYLKPQGAGLLGLIFSRNGGDAAGCAHSLREQWLIHQKMILIFNDEEVESMLRTKEDGRAPEEMIGKKIEQFRLSM